MRFRQAAVIGVPVAVWVAAAGCHRRSVGATAEVASCAAADSARGTVDVPQLRGKFALTMVATDGPRASSTQQGLLELRAQADSLVRVPRPMGAPAVLQQLVGTLDVAIDSLGATRMGDAMSTNPLSPGVGVYTSAGTAGPPAPVVLRIGSLSNGRGPSGIDAGHFTMFVREASANEFRGNWLSSPGTGMMGNQDARGYFCAVRQTS